MRRLAYGPVSAALVLFCVAATGCQQLFTTSVATWAVRPAQTISTSISAADAQTIAIEASANGDSKMASALLSALIDKIAAGGSETESLKAVAAGAAVTASGAGVAILGPFETALAGGEVSSETISSLVLAIQAGTTAEVLAGISYLADPAVLASSGLGATELVIAASIIAMSALPAGVTDPTTLTGQALTDFQNSPAVQTAGSIVAAATADLVASGLDPALAQQLASFFSIP